MNTTSNDTRKNLLIGSLIAIWLFATLLGLWWFQQQTIRPFISAEDDQRLWQAKQVEQLLQSAVAQIPGDNQADVVLFHFWNPDCLCNQVSQRHFNGILREFNQQQLRVMAITSTNTSAEQIAEFNQLNSDRIDLIQVAPEQLPLSASPGLALFNRIDGKFRMGYFGAYGFGALCTVANDDFFPNIVRKMKQGPYGPFVNVAGDGCFCSWTEKPEQ